MKTTIAAGEELCGAKPPWLKVRLGQGERFGRTQRLIREQRLHTVCEAALCPNRGRCWSEGRATFLILGDRCTRGCGFCNVAPAAPGPPEPEEPRRVAEAVRRAGLAEVVITSVTRDDLPDGGAAHWAATIRCVRAALPALVLEVLIPDFGGSEDALACVVEAGPTILGHNLETVRSLYPRVRPRADYDRSLAVLRRAHAGGVLTKTGIMVGLGETEDEVLALMRDAVAAGCDLFTVGQYLQPSRRHLPVRRYVPPGEFDGYREAGLRAGFKVVVAGPLVRSSYYAPEQAAFVAQVRRPGAALRPAPTEGGRHAPIRCR